MQQKIIIANWKMNPIKESDALALASDIIKNIPKKFPHQVIIAPPIMFLSSLVKKYKTASFSAQDGFSEDEGAYTGQVSCKQIYALGARHVIVGHSEVRAQGDTDEVVSLKTRSALKNKLTPVVCVGEKERSDDHWHFHLVKDQIEKVVKGLEQSQVKKLMFAYEPVWAIGKKALRTATPEECMEMVIFIRRVLTDMFGEKVAKQIPILYGGSVDEKNASTFLTTGGADGLLVGRASLDKKAFEKIIKF